MIVESLIVADAAQADGRRQVLERHVDSAGREWFASYMCEAKDDPQALAEARVPTLNAQIAAEAEDREAERQALAAQAEVLKELSVAQVAAVLMVDDDEAARKKAEADKPGDVKDAQAGGRN